MSYKSTRAVFLKTLERMKSDLEEYKQHAAAKPRYIEKQSSIIAVMEKFLEATDTAIETFDLTDTASREETKKLYSSIEALTLLCDMAHVEPLFVTYALDRGRTWIEQRHECHCYACLDQRHDFYRNRYKSEAGTGMGLYRNDIVNHIFFKKLGIPYPA